MATVSLTGILQLSVPERIQLVQDIWDSIAAESEKLVLTDAQREELDRRLGDLEANPSAGVPWQDVSARSINRR
jgi:putative addiction module component (TIGR02574 family)